VVPKIRHTRSTPQLPLATPKDYPEKIIKRGKTSQECLSTVVPGDPSNPQTSSLKNPLVASNFPFIPSVGVYRSLNFGSIPIEFSPSRPHFEEIFDTPISPEVIQCFNPIGSEVCPILGFPTPSLFIVAASKEGESSFPFSPRSSVPVSLVQTPRPPGSPIVHIQMEGANLPRNKMDSMVPARYDPLVLPQPMNPLLVGDYLKYIPKFTREEDITI
jgi:hypothetical protein